MPYKHEPLEADEPVSIMYKNKKILITGGTGTIGQHLVRHLLKELPNVIRIFSRDEYKQFEMQQTLSEFNNIRYLIGDVRDASRLIRAMEDIDYVFHLAAMKHVPFCEYNPFEAVQTNVIGTQNVIQASIQAGVKKVLFMSSDKAISPTNTYGATKLMGERLISAAEYQKGPKSTIFSAVRFGNVMGSRGSIIPLFKKQILEERRVTVTDPDITRYMMTPNQAIALMLEANERAKGGEVFVLKMPIIRLGDLVTVMVRAAQEKYGYKGPVTIETIGLRPGEKRYEELMTADERAIATETSTMYIIPSPFHMWGEQDKEEMISTDESNCLPEVIGVEELQQWIVQEGLI